MNTEPEQPNLIQPVDPTKFEPGRTVWVLLHKDRTHFFSMPTGEVDWDYNKSTMELREKILKQDFNNHNYILMTLADAMPLFCNTQADLVKLWTPTINLIRKAKDTGERRAIYERFARRHKVAHPLEADALLKRLLGYK